MTPHLKRSPPILSLRFNSLLCIHYYLILSCLSVYSFLLFSLRVGIRPCTVSSESGALKVLFAMITSMLGTVHVEDAQKTYFEQINECIQATGRSVKGEIDDIFCFIS